MGYGGGDQVVVTWLVVSLQIIELLMQRVDESSIRRSQSKSKTRYATKERDFLRWLGTRELIRSQGKVNMGCDILLGNRINDSVDSTSPAIWIRGNKKHNVSQKCWVHLLLRIQNGGESRVKPIIRRISSIRRNTTYISSISEAL